MAASVNNIAATFSTVPLSSSTFSPSSSSSPPPSKQSIFPLPFPHANKPISISWNPHSSIPKSLRSSFLAVYGPPGPPPHSILKIPKSLSPPPLHLIGKKLPDSGVSYLDRRGNIQEILISSIGKGRKIALVGVAAAFSVRCEEYVRDVSEARSRAVDLVACVAANDVVVMKAWERILDLGEKAMMMSDLKGDLCRELGMVLECGGLGFGLGFRCRRFCLSAVDGVIVNFSVDEDDEVEGNELVSQEMKTLKLS